MAGERPAARRRRLADLRRPQRRPRRRPPPRQGTAAAAHPSETPAPGERAARLRTGAAMIYLVVNEGYSATGGGAQRRAPLCGEAIRLARLLLRLYPDEPEIMGLVALLLFQNARAAARLDADGGIVLLEDQDRSSWDRSAINEG